MSVCGKIFQGFDNPCEIEVNGYRQIAVPFNLDDIDKDSIVINRPDYEAGECDYTVEFTLKEGKKGFAITAIDAGTTIRGQGSETRNEQGYPVYIHNVDIFLSGIDVLTKCMLHSLDAGRYAIALMGNDGTVEIYGFRNGITSGDYDYNITENGGGSVITLSSLENSPEGMLPLVYKAGSGSTPELDFESLFENAGA